MKASFMGVSVALAVFAAVIVGCESKPPSRAGTSVAEVAAPVAQLPADLFVEQSPEGAVAVGALKTDTTSKSSVIVHGRIGGRKEPFVSGSSMFLLADMSVKACSELEGDTCPTPWDYCCEPKENLAKMLATVQVVGADGKPLAIELDGKNGLKPLAEVTIAGEIASREGGTLLLTARKIHVHAKRG